MAKFTFKYDKAETGLRAIGNGNRSSDIKLKGKECGRILAPNWNSSTSEYRIQLRVKDSTYGKRWKNITLKYKNESESEVRGWLQDNTDKILDIYIMHFHED